MDVENCRCPDIGRNHINPGGARYVGRKPTFWTSPEHTISFKKN